jgi:hypothetical protein
MQVNMFIEIGAGFILNTLRFETAYSFLRVTTPAFVCQEGQITQEELPHEVQGNHDK